ncbi:hypothetical protein GGQ80_003026 [Sphingomonas jinjuensis]|uniref:Alginate export domain-containing protein n=1 Tax=Sphingomonas jinjuensis TaxID=535907 RepID=A0A840FBT3_9SPHN|nr:alginate export family protein [Sphingomonas jinjuensis]MBB4155109.1 hypothetical protein [Sphingomonas jinjuensis]
MLKTLFVTTVLLASSTPSAAQLLNLSGTERVRAEAVAGQARTGFNGSDQLLNLRTTVLAVLNPGPIKFSAELWDSRVYNANRRTPLTTGEVNTFELVQAYATVALAKGSKGAASLQLGRFLINLGSRRLVAADDYRNTTNGYTGARLDVKRGPWNATAIYTLPQQRRPDDLDSLLAKRVAPDLEGFDLVLWGAIASRAATLGPVAVEGSFFHLGERDRPGRPTRDRSLDAASVRLIRDPTPARFDGEIEAIAERGTVSASLAATAPRQSVRAWFLHADAGYTFASRWQPRLSAEYDHASGDAPGGRYGRFDTLFGMRRADLAPAGLYNAIARTNIVSPGLRLEAVPDQKTDLFVAYKPIWLASRFDAFAATGVRDATGRSGSFAGHQVDGRIRYKLRKSLMLEADAVLLAKGRFLREAPNAPPGRWTRYLSFNALASF